MTNTTLSTANPGSEDEDCDPGLYDDYDEDDDYYEDEEDNEDCDEEDDDFTEDYD